MPCFLLVGLQFVFEPVARALYLHDFKDISGAAEGLSGFMQTGAMAAASAAASRVISDDGDPRNFYWCLCACAAASNLWFWLALGARAPDGALGHLERRAAAPRGRAPPGADGGDDDAPAYSRLEDGSGAADAPPPPRAPPPLPGPGCWIQCVPGACAPAS